VIKGNLNLSLDLKRLGFIKVLVWLTRPSSYIYNEPLLSKFKEIVKKYRDAFEWKVDPFTGKTVSGMGIGDEKSSATRDSIAKDHLQLAQSFGFLKKEINTWGKNGLILASQYINERGQPLFFDNRELDKLLQIK